MSGRRIDLSATQVVASMLAAVTGAVAASTLGIAGTVIGAAVMSVASTAVAAIYKHYIARSRERLRAAAEAARIPPLVGGGAGSALRRLQRASQTAQQTGQAAPTVPDRRRVAGADADQTEVFPAVRFGQHRWHDADRANGFAPHPHSPADGATEIIGGAAADASAAEAGGRTASRASAAEADDGRTAEFGAGGTAAGGGGRTTAEVSGGRAGDAGPRDAGRSRWRRPLVMAGVALGIFLLAMGGITAFEAVAGKPLDTIVGGRHDSGTTVGSLFGGQSAHTASHRGTHAPAPTPGASTSPTPTPTPTTTPTPTATPTPTPTRSAGTSPSPSTSASADPAATQ
jgi:hypothetical protein